MGHEEDLIVGAFNAFKLFLEVIISKTKVPNCVDITCGIQGSYDLVKARLVVPCNVLTC